MERRTTSIPSQLPPKSGTVIDAKLSLAMWLKAGRANKGFSLADVARITKIQPRILERLEAGKLDGLPAEVFVRGFVRNVAKCVGLDVSEANARYGAAIGQPTTIPTARALVDSMSELAPTTASVLAPVMLLERPEASGQMMVQSAPVDVQVGIEQPAPLMNAIEVATATVATAPVAPVVEEPVVITTSAIEVIDVSKGKKGRTRRPRGTQPDVRGNKRNKAQGTPVEALPLVVEVAPLVETAVDVSPVVIDHVPLVETAADELFGADQSVDIKLEDVVEPVAPAFAAIASEDTTTSGPLWSPRMPTVTHSPAPWRRAANHCRNASKAPPVPTLVIDDSDPDSAERELEERTTAKEPRKSFLPPILAERARMANANGQGTLTLAVIILLIAATLTLSYLMRRPSSSGDGVTSADGTSQLIG